MENKFEPLIIAPNQGNHGETIYIQTERGKVISEVWVHFESQEIEAMQYAKLFRAAPDLIKELYNTYLQLQILVRKDLLTGSATMAVKTDAIRASLRNTISAAIGIDCEILQNEIECNAVESTIGKL